MCYCWIGNNGDIFTNDAGQNVPNPEGYATMSKFNLTREIFSILAQVFPDKFITKENTDVPKDLNFSKIKRDLYIN